MRKFLKYVVIFVATLKFANDVENTQETLLESELLKDIESADSLFYQAVAMWVKNADEASKNLQKACDRKHPGACLYLGSYYDTKSRDKKDSKENLEKSKQYYQLGYDYSLQACKEGGAQWCAIQAVALIDGLGAPKDVEKGLSYLDVMCENEIENACFVLGSYYFYGVNVDKDLQRASGLHHKALELDSKKCDERLKYACVISAEIYQQGLSVASDLTKAKDFYNRACSLDNQFACDYVGRLK